MRSKSTNALQGTVLLTGIVYVAAGLFFFISPYKAFKLFSDSMKGRQTALVEDFDGESGKEIKIEEITEDDWLKQIINDEIISPLYYLFRVFSALLFVCGLAMIMPLFDPLRYRGLIYYNGLIYPLLSVITILLFMQSQRAIDMKIAADMQINNAARQNAHLAMVVMAAVFAVIFILTAFCIIITRKQAHDGKE